MLQWLRGRARKEDGEAASRTANASGKEYRQKMSGCWSRRRTPPVGVMRQRAMGPRDARAVATGSSDEHAFMEETEEPSTSIFTSTTWTTLTL